MNRDTYAVIASWLGLFGAAVALLWANGAGAQYQAATEQECRVFADAALVARSHQLSGIEQARALKALYLIYDLPNDRLRAVAVAINGAAYAGGETRSAPEFGVGLYQSCINHRGDLTPYLGRAM
jgi:hypothetical protein